MSNLRKVVIYKWQRNKDIPMPKKVVDGHGLFHQFGTDYEEFETGAGNYPVAIVELLDGNVKVVHAELIQFEN